MKVTAVVPAYNEENTIGPVLKALEQVESINEIIVINDGSTDDTAKIAGEYNVNLINLKKNMGKSPAVKKVCENLDSDIIFFCDADLVSFKPQYAEQIIFPVLRGKAGMSVGLRDYKWWNPMQKKMMIISGERAILNSALQDCFHSKYFERDWGMEPVMNEYCRRNELPVVLEVFPYNQIMTYYKTGPKGAWKLVKEGVQIAFIFLFLRVFNLW